MLSRLVLPLVVWDVHVIVVFAAAAQVGFLVNMSLQDFGTCAARTPSSWPLWQAQPQERNSSIDNACSDQALLLNSTVTLGAADASEGLASLGRLSLVQT